jgi:hypothetical protein
LVDAPRYPLLTGGDTGGDPIYAPRNLLLIGGHMDYDALSTGVRKFFRKLRVTAQREIEKAVRDADATRKLTGTTLPTRAIVTVGSIDLKFDVDGDIELA